MKEGRQKESKSPGSQTGSQLYKQHAGWKRDRGSKLEMGRIHRGRKRGRKTDKQRKKIRKDDREEGIKTNRMKEGMKTDRGLKRGSYTNRKEGS